jgi:hypothetical protein
VNDGYNAAVEDFLEVDAIAVVGVDDAVDHGIPTALR